MSEQNAGSGTAASSVAAEASKAPAAAASPETKSAAAEIQEELIELLLEEGKPAVKVPMSKVNPHLAKYRSETDKLRSEYDKNAKELQGRASKIEQVLRAAKDDTDGMLRELGVDPEEYAERKLSARVQAALREAEEKADPKKKETRERDEELESLRKKNKERDEADQKRERDGHKGRLKAAIDATVAKLPEKLRGDAVPDVIAVFRQAISEKRDITIEDAAKAVTALIRARARSAYEADDELRKALGGAPLPPKPGEKPAAKVVEHPAAKGVPRDERGKFKQPVETDGAGDVLQKIARGKF